MDVSVCNVSGVHSLARHGSMRDRNVFTSSLPALTSVRAYGHAFRLVYNPEIWAITVFKSVRDDNIICLCRLNIVSVSRLLLMSTYSIRYTYVYRHAKLSLHLGIVTDGTPINWCNFSDCL